MSVYRRINFKKEYELLAKELTSRSIVAVLFLGETKVKTEDGFIAIKDIVTVNKETGQEGYKEVKKVFVRSGNALCIIKDENDIIK